MKYFVSGATGFIGGRVVRQLIGCGHQVHALVRTPKTASNLAELGVRLYVGDITSKDSLRAPMAAVDGVFHLAAWYKIGARHFTLAERINVEGTRNVLELMGEFGIPRGVYTSTVAVFSDTKGQLVDESYRHDGPWLSEYDRTKWMAHYHVALPMIQKGLPLVIVQPGVVYGPGDTSAIREALVQFLKGSLPLTPKQTAFCWSHVEDTARGHILAMDRGKPGESYILAGPAHTFQEVIELAEKITGIRGPRLHPSPTTMRALSQLMKWLGGIIPLPESYSAESLRVIAGVTYLGNNGKAIRELGFRVRPLEEGLKETLEYEMRCLNLIPNQQTSAHNSLS